MSDGVVSSAPFSEFQSLVWPVFERHSKTLSDGEGNVSVDMFDYAHGVVSEAMILLILGKVCSFGAD